MIIHDKLSFNMVSARRMRKNLSDEQNQERVKISQKLHRFENVGDQLLIA